MEPGEFLKSVCEFSHSYASSGGETGRRNGTMRIAGRLVGAPAFFIPPGLNSRGYLLRFSKLVLDYK